MTTPPQKFERILADVAAYVRAHPGCMRSELAAMVTGSNGAIVHAVNALLRDGFVAQRARRRLWPVPVPDGPCPAVGRSPSDYRT